MCYFCPIYLLLFAFNHRQEWRLCIFKSIFCIKSFNDDIFVFSSLNFCFFLQHNIYPYIPSLIGKPAPKSWFVVCLGILRFPSLWNNTILFQAYWPLLEKDWCCIEWRWKAEVYWLDQLAKCTFSVSHGSAVPERGFSTNKKLLEAHGDSVREFLLRFVVVFLAVLILITLTLSFIYYMLHIFTR